MKIYLPARLMITTLLSLWLVSGCADQAAKKTDSMASPQTQAAIAGASAAIEAAKANNWIWRDTEDFLDQARGAADRGDNDTAISLANEAKFQAEAAVIQYQHEKDHPRGF